MSGREPIPPAPSDGQMNRLASVVAPLARVTRPDLLGVERIPETPALFVGNHTILGFLDLPFLMTGLWTARGIKLRGLGEHGHYAIPVWRELLERCGMVRGTRDNVRALMSAGENVLVFPGGAGEVFKGRGQQYQLLWKERLGFARLAIEHSYPIVPCAAVGAEEMLDVVADANHPVYGPVADVLRRVSGLPVPPLVRGIGPTPIPRPKRLYFWFGDPIRTRRYSGLHEDQKALREVRDKVKASVESGIDFLLAEREASHALSTVGGTE